MDTFPMNLSGWQIGLSLDEFVARMNTHPADMRRRLREVALSPQDRSASARIEAPIHIG